jgi:hypothetical protein
MRKFQPKTLAGKVDPGIIKKAQKAKIISQMSCFSRVNVIWRINSPNMVKKDRCRANGMYNWLLILAVEGGGQTLNSGRRPESVWMA